VLAPATAAGDAVTFEAATPTIGLPGVYVLDVPETPPPAVPRRRSIMALVDDAMEVTVAATPTTAGAFAGSLDGDAAMTTASTGGARGEAAERPGTDGGVSCTNMNDWRDVSNDGNDGGPGDTSAAGLVLGLGSVQGLAAASAASTAAVTYERGTASGMLIVVPAAPTAGRGGLLRPIEYAWADFRDAVARMAPDSRCPACTAASPHVARSHNANSMCRHLMHRCSRCYAEGHVARACPLKATFSRACHACCLPFMVCAEPSHPCTYRYPARPGRGSVLDRLRG
jgi:hypothetical protein